MLLTFQNKLEIFHSVNITLVSSNKYFQDFLTLSARSWNHLLKQHFFLGGCLLMGFPFRIISAELLALFGLIKKILKNVLAVWHANDCKLPWFWQRALNGDQLFIRHTIFKICVFAWVPIQFYNSEQLKLPKICQWMLILKPPCRCWTIFQLWALFKAARFRWRALMVISSTSFVLFAHHTIFLLVSLLGPPPKFITHHEQLKLSKMALCQWTLI